MFKDKEENPSVKQFPDYGNRHGNKAKNGWYRYDTRFGIPVYSEVGEIERYNIFRARMLVRCDANGKLFLYDIMQITYHFYRKNGFHNLDMHVSLYKSVRRKDEFRDQDPDSNREV